MKSARISSLEFGRLIAILAVITIHAGPLRGDAYSDQINVISDIINQICRFAVPFFFLLAGYFVYPKLSQAPTETFKRFSRPLIFIWLAWSVVYLILPMRYDIVGAQGYFAERTRYIDYLLKSPLNSLFEGGFVHLWYIPSLLIAIGMLALFIRYNKTRWILPSAVGLFMWGLAAGSYSPIFHAETIIMSRNGPFFSFLMVAIGYFLHQRNSSLTSWQAGSIFVMGLITVLLEGAFLTRYDQWLANHDFLFATPFVAIGLFYLLKNNPSIGQAPIIQALSQRVLGVYVCHFVILFLLWNIFRTFQIAGLMKDILLIPLTLILSFTLTFLLEQFPLTQKLISTQNKRPPGKTSIELNTTP